MRAAGVRKLRWVCVGSAVLVLVAACGGGAAAGQGSEPLIVLPPQHRQAPVVLAGPTLGGGRLDLAPLRGRVVVLNVWGSWCGPCRKEAPELERAYTQLKPRGVAFVGIDTRDEDASARAFVAEFSITYPSLVDDGTLLLSLHGAAPPSAVPTTLVLDPQGRVAARVLGATDATTVTGLVEDVLAESGRTITGTALPRRPPPAISRPIHLPTSHDPANLNAVDPGKA